MVLLPLALLSAQAIPAEEALDRQLVGTWRLVSVDNVGSDGSRVALYGPNPTGLLMFDAHGRYASQIMRAERPRFASGKKSDGTPAEYKATAQGVNAHFGEYAADRTGGRIVFRIQHALFPNWEGTTQEREFTLEGDELKYRVPAPTSGGGIDEVVWRRAD
jgi:hypothetical protein